jgi:putative flippase GtrA
VKRIWRERLAGSSVGQLLKFGMIGATTNAAGYLLYLFVTYLGGTPKATMSVLYVAGAAVGFWGNRVLTFGYSGNLWRARLRYAVAYLAGYLINLALLAILVDGYGYAHQIVQAIATVAVAAFLFVTLKLCVFREPNT